MTAATATREQVRLLAIQHNLIEASKLSGVPYETVKKWSQRYKWKQTPTHAQANVPSVPIADKLTEELEANGRATKLSLSRYTARAAKDAERATLRDSGHVLNVAKTHQVLFPPQENKSNILNLAILTGREIPEKHVEGEVIENE